MAPFNPSPQLQQIPNFEQLARPTYFTPKPDESGKIRGDTIAKAIREGVSTADTVFKEMGTAAVEKDVADVQKPWTGALEEATGRTPSVPEPGSQAALAGVGSPAPVNTDDQVTKDTIHQELRGMQNVQSAYNQKKISWTQYWGLMNEKAQSTRNQFWGYRDHIDEEFKRITGHNPANAYAQSMVQDLQAAAAGKDKEYNEALSSGYAANKEGWTGAPNAIAQLRAYHDSNGKEGWSIDQFNSEVNKANSTIHALKVAKDALEFKNLATKTGQEQAQKYLDNSLAFSANSAVSSAMYGVKDLDSPEHIAAWVQKMQLNPTDPQLGQNAEAAALKVHASADNWERLEEQKILEKVKDPITGESKTLLEAVGGRQAFNEHLKTGRAVFDRIEEALKNKDFGLAGLYMRMNQATKAGGEHALYTDKTLGQQMVRWEAMRDKLGKDYFDTLNNAMLTSGLKDNILNYVMGAVADVNDPASGKTADSVIREMKARGITDPKAFNIVIGQAKNIMDPKVSPEGKLKLVHTFFDPDGRKLLNQDNFSKDYKDAQGKWHSGRTSVYSIFGSDKMASSIAELSKTHPEAGKIYKDFMEETFSSHLFSKEIQDLNEIPGVKGVSPLLQSPTTPHWNLKLHWNAPEGQAPFWSINDPEHKLPVAGSVLKPALQDSLDRINGGIHGLYNAYKHFGGDVNSQLLKVFVDHGVDVKDAEGIPAQMMKSLLASHPSNGELPRMEDKNNFSAEEKPTPAQKAIEESIKGSANAARSGNEWGNPLQEGFAEKHLTNISVGGHSVQVNKVAAEAFQGFLNDLSKEYKIKDIGGYSLRRNKSNPDALSQHAYGNAIDINPNENPYVGNPFMHKMKTDLPANISRLAAKWGISWGGDWSSVKDPMHFEYTGKNPQTAAQ